MLMLFRDNRNGKPIPDQINDRAAQIIMAGAFTLSRARCQGVMHTIDTP